MTKRPLTRKGFYNLFVSKALKILTSTTKKHTLLFKKMHRDFLIHAKLCTFLSTNKMHFGDMRVKRYLSKKKKQNVELFYELFYS